jgi:hypothetical protein
MKNRISILSVQMLRRIGQWMAWGSLGPILLLIGAVSLYGALRLLQSDPDEYQDPLAVTAAVLDGLTAVVGGLLIFRPNASYWRPLIVAVAMCVANFGSDLHRYGLTLSSIQVATLWVIEAGVLAFYASHCHVPGYRWGARLLPGQPDHVPRESSV